MYLPLALRINNCYKWVVMNIYFKMKIQYKYQKQGWVGTEGLLVLEAWRGQWKTDTYKTEQVC